METTTIISKTNREVIGKTYETVRQQCFSIFRQACIAPDTCEDLVQEVFLKVLGIDVIIEDQLKGLVIQMAYQKRTDYLRHRAYINKVHGELAWRMEQSYTDTDAEMKDIEQVELKAIDCMSEKDAQIYQMIRFEDKTADEIVLETGLTKRAVESRIYRTRTQVRNAVRMAMAQ